MSLGDLGGRRQRLLDAAVDAFGEKGYHRTTTRDIATAAGVSPAALYVHHRSKEDLLYLISRRGHEDILRLVEAQLGSTNDPIAQITAMMTAWVRQHAAQHTVSRVVNYELGSLTAEHRREIMAIRGRLQAMVRAAIQAGVARGDFRVDDVGLASVAVLSLGVDVARWHRPGGAWSAEEVARQYAVLALRILGADPGRVAVAGSPAPGEAGPGGVGSVGPGAAGSAGPGGVGSAGPGAVGLRSGSVPGPAHRALPTEPR